MPEFQLLQLFNSSSARGSRTTVMSPLGWITSIVFVSLWAVIQAKAGPVVTGIVLGLAVLLVLSYVGAFFYFSVKSPDLLRSERFWLEKAAIEHSMTGDSMSGIGEPLTQPTIGVPPTHGLLVHGSDDKP